jgi:ABC-type oligopeptide transport system ATPase subunit
MTGDLALDVEKLTKVFGRGPGFVRRRRGMVVAVDGISFSVKRGETLGLVGES